MKVISKETIINTCLTVGGLTMVEIVWAYQIDYKPWEIVFYRILGIIIAIIGAYLFARQINDKKKAKMDCSYFKENANDNFLSKFRNDITQFFNNIGIDENMALQYDCTQLYYNVLSLQKKRLERLKVDFKFHSMRKNAAGNYHKREEYFDGKYNIRELEQEIEAKKIFYVGKKPVLIKGENEIAHYTLINAKQVGEDEVVCPNCGSVSSRENLIDGCDYCSTKFTVEDLGEKISSSAFRDSADLAYQKFKAARMEKFEAAYSIMFFVWSLICALMFAVLMTDEESAGAGGDSFNPILFTASFIVVAGCFGMLLAGITTAGYLFIVMPLMEAFAFIKYNTKKHAEELKKNEEMDVELQKKVREFDPLFSISEFYSNIQNKVSSIIFSDTNEDRNAFSEKDLSSSYEKYQRVIDYDVQKMSLKDYKVEDGLQKAIVEIDLRLYVLLGTKVKNRSEKIKLNVVKSKDCKTQVIGAPKVMRCKGCGSSLSYTNGLICSYCGTKPDLKEYDWTIV